MSLKPTENLLEISEIAKRAGKKILEVYESSDFDVELKGDNSPLTRADRNANELIISELSRSFSIPILSEEGKTIPFEDRSDWTEYFLVDPLDGTKEFIKRNGEFTVNIALIKNGCPVLGVVYVPVTGETYMADEGGAWKESNGSVYPIHVKSNQSKKLTVIASRSHLSDETKDLVDRLSAKYEIEFVSKGSSLKLCLVAEGKADLYPRLAPTMEWDTAAAQAVVEKAGGFVFDFHSKSAVIYNKENLLNPWFVVSSNEGLLREALG